jgi:hypothetical protein
MGSSTATIGVLLRKAEATVAVPINRNRALLRLWTAPNKRRETPSRAPVRCIAPATMNSARTVKTVELAKPPSASAGSRTPVSISSTSAPKTSVSGVSRSWSSPMIIKPRIASVSQKSMRDLSLPSRDRPVRYPAPRRFPKLCSCDPTRSSRR